MAIGERLPVVDGTLRVRGDVPYVLNSEAPRLLAVALVRSSLPHARLTTVDVREAEKAPGVVAVISRDDLAADPRLSPYFGPLVRDQPVLAMDRVRYVGEPIAAIAAEDLDAAREAAARVRLEYEALDPVLTMDDGASAEAPRLHDGANRMADYSIRHGDLQEGFAAADVVLDAVYTTPPLQHAPLEPHCVLARTEPNGRIVVESSTQTPHAVRRQLAEIFGVPISQVRVTVPTLGGAFGSKCYTELEPLAVLLARKARRPVKLVLSRSEEFLTAQRQGARFHLKSGATRDGRLVALHAVCEMNNGAYFETADRITRHAARGVCAAYRIPHLLVESCAYYTNLVPCGPFRAPGAAQAIWAIESHVDEIAAALGMDPVELRLRNVVQSGDSYVDSGLLEHMRFPQMLRSAAQAVGWGEPAPPVSATEKVGRGVAVILKVTNTPSTSSASVKLNEDGSLDVLTSSVEMGQGAGTALAQIAADRAAVPMERVRVSSPDTDTTPYDQATSSSRTTFAMGEAISRAIDEVRTQLKNLAAAHLEASPDDVLLENGGAHVAGAPDRGVDFGALVRGSRSGNLLGSAVYVTSAKPDPVTGAPGASAHYHQATGAAEVAVDVETGRVRVLRAHAGTFAGRAINPTLCELQVEGSSIFGLGQALSEEVVYDNGQVTNSNMGDYLIPSFVDVPALDTAVYEERDHGEVHGIGEVAAPLLPPAIANAVAQAVGVRMRDLPLTPERVLAALRAQAAQP